MAEIEPRAPTNIRFLERHRGRAISPSTTVRINGTIAANATNILLVVSSRVAAVTGRLRAALRVGEAFIVGTPSRPDHALPREAAAIHSSGAFGVRSARAGYIGRAYSARRSRAGLIRLARWTRAALRGAAGVRSPMVLRNPCAAPRNDSRIERSLVAGNGYWHRASVCTRAVARFVHLAPAAKEENKRPRECCIPHEEHCFARIAPLQLSEVRQ
jgi:hypothetical protein